MKKLVLAAALAVSGFGCAQRGTIVRGTPITQAEFEALLAPEPGSTAADYHAEAASLRLYGVQSNAATFADTRDWSVRSVAVGDLVSRNLRLTSLSPVTLSDGTILTKGQSVPAHLIHHRFDDAALYRGKGQFEVDGAALADVRTQHGDGAIGESRDLYLAQMTELIAVDPEGAFGRLGFRTGDFVVKLDGDPIGPAELGRVLDAATHGGTMQLEVVRDGTLREWSYRILE